MITGNQVGLARFVQASTTTERLVAQEMTKPKPLLCTPKPEPLSRMSGFGSHHSAVVSPPKVASQPVVPGR